MNSVFPIIHKLIPHFMFLNKQAKIDSKQIKKKNYNMQEWKVGSTRGHDQGWCVLPPA